MIFFSCPEYARGKGLRPLQVVCTLLCALWCINPAWADTAPVSQATQTCLACHTSLHPGIVHSWEKSRHSQKTPEQGQKEDELSKRVSSQDIPQELASVVVGCAECHCLRSQAHAGSFNHNGFEVHNVVSPDDCALCHQTERSQYKQNLMSKARGNLKNNPVYMDLAENIHGQPKIAESKLDFAPAHRLTEEESCFYCHGSKITTKGLQTRTTAMGPMQFPILQGWPNQGVGRINTDGSQGSCSACHTRHTFSVVTARKPSTCKECHIGPDVPAYKVYSTSKHGNIASSHSQTWDFESIPWTIGRDFTAPTCAVCHISLTVDPGGNIVAKRTHRMNDRLSWRLFGLIYAHAHPKDADTSIIRNADDLPLPTDFAGNPATDFLISSDTQKQRQTSMQGICAKCHSASWVKGHYQRLEHTIQASNKAVGTGTSILQRAWDLGHVQGLDQGESPFDQHLEKIWSKLWLINANKVRFASAMAGGGDYGVFAQGRYALSNNLAAMQDWVQERTIQKNAEDVTQNNDIRKRGNP